MSKSKQEEAQSKGLTQKAMLLVSRLFGFLGYRLVSAHTPCLRDSRERICHGRACLNNKNGDFDVSISSFLCSRARAKGILYSKVRNGV